LSYSVSKKEKNNFLKRFFPSNNFGDFIFERLTWLFALSVFLLVILMGYEMYEGSKISIQKFGFDFLVNSEWDPVQEIYGALPIIYGTIVSSLLALIIALPFSIGVAVYLAEVAPPWLEKPLSFLVELLAGIPSVIYGLWGIFVLVPWIRTDVEPYLSDKLGFLPFFRGAPYGFGLLAAVLILTIMVLPIITSITRDVLKSVPSDRSNNRQSTIIVLKDAKSGILGATMLGFGRAIGETMAVTMVIGNRALISPSLFDPSYTMASVIANEFTEATSEMYLSALIQLALVLFVITIFVNALARLLVWSMERKWKTT